MAIDQFPAENGSYTLDPKSGRYTLVPGSRTEESIAQQVIVDEQPIQSVTTKEAKTDGIAA